MRTKYKWDKDFRENSNLILSQFNIQYTSF